MTYTVTARSNNTALGSVSPFTQEVEEGGGVVVTATATGGNVIDTWDGVDSGTGVGTASGEGRVSNVRENRNVTCNFKIQSGGGSGSKTVISFNKNLIVQGINGLDLNSTSQALLDNNGDVQLTYLRWDTAGQAVDDKPRTSDAMNAVETVGTPYDFEVYKVSAAGYDSSEEASTKRLYLQAVAGTYRVRIYANTNNGAVGKSRNRVYTINGQDQIPDFEVKNNVDNYIVFDNVTPVDGIITIQVRGTVAWVVIPMNVIEIEKIS